MKTKTKTKTKSRPKITVSVWEHDSWSGAEELWTQEFSTRYAALNFCKKYNSRNNLPSAPGVYTEAHIKGEGLLERRSR